MMIVLLYYHDNDILKQDHALRAFKGCKQLNKSKSGN